jgi:malate permease and related proteins
VFCEVTVGYYIGSRGHHTVQEALKRVVKLPIIYGMIAGIIWSATGYDLPAPIHAMWQNFLGAFSILGMMIVGLALGHIKHFTWDSKLFAWLLGVKAIIWPVVATALLLAGVGTFLATFDPRMPLLFILIAAVPLAGNTPAYAALTGLPTDKAAIATLLSTLLSIVTIPVTLALVNLVYPLGY